MAPSPAPKSADFSLYIHVYWPEPAVLTGQWVPPAVVKAIDQDSTHSKQLTDQLFANSPYKRLGDGRLKHRFGGVTQ